MTKPKLGKKNLSDLNFKLISVSNENYLLYQLLSPHSPVSSSS